MPGSRFKVVVRGSGFMCGENLELEPRTSNLRTRNLEPGTWNLEPEPGTWNPEPGTPEFPFTASSPPLAGKV